MSYRQLLPASMLDVAEAIDDDQVLANFIATFGGLRIYVSPMPRRGRLSGRLLEVLGEASYLKLVGFYGAGMLDVPKCRAYMRAMGRLQSRVVDREGIARLAGTYSINELAKQFDCDRTTVCRVLSTIKRQAVMG